MALGTWKEDPLENRELQETVDANVTTNVSAADLADIKKEEQLDAVLINQGVITQQTVDGLDADRVDLSDEVTGGNKSIISKKNQKLLDKKSKKANPKGNKITKPAPPTIKQPAQEIITVSILLTCLSKLSKRLNAVFHLSAQTASCFASSSATSSASIAFSPS